MIDDEKLQELLTRASSLYNSGEYKGAIEAWKEALGVDPASQKAREGIRMATLLLGDFDAVPPGEPVEDAAIPADGADPAAADVPVEESEARIDLGVARVKQLLAERKYAEAIEGAQGLLPLDPDSPEIIRLLEEAQHAFESTPFIEDHLTLARELLAQARFSEAEAECKKVFTLDATHPGAKTLLKEIRDKIQASLKAAASQLGGMTVKLTMPQAIAAGIKLKSTPRAEPPEPPPSRTAADPLPEVFEGAEPLPGEEPRIPESGEGALAQEDVAARAALENAFNDPAPGASAPEDSPFELAGEGADAAGAPDPAAVEEEIVEARTVRPPTTRVVPKEPVAAATTVPPAKPSPEVKSTPAQAGAPVVPPPIVSAPPKKIQEPSPVPSPPAKGVTAKGAAPPPTPATPSAQKTAPHPPTAAPAIPVPVAEVGEEATAAWETELTQLNLKDKERGLLRGTGAKATGRPVEAGDLDLMSLLDSGGMPGMPGTDADKAIPQPESVPLAKGKATPKAEAHPAGAMRLRQPERPRPAPAAPGRGSPLMKYLLLFVLLLGGGGAAWYYYIKPQLLPRLLGGAGQPSHPVAPPAGAPAGTVDGGHAPIPTPIGGTSRQQIAAPQHGDGASVSAGVVQGGVPGPANPAATAPATAPSAPGQGQGAATPGATATNPVPQSTEPLKPPTVPAMSKEEMQRKIAAYTADGRRMIGLGKWREARAKLNAVLALDPANLEVKELADQAQAKIDDDQKLQDEFDSTKKLYADKDYENALRKLYRLPRDKGLGDIDLYIRNSWYNWALVLMKAGNSKDALAKLSEELTVDPDDASALKLQEVAEKYMNRAKDRTYYAFTDGLALRALDQK